MLGKKPVLQGLLEVDRVRHHARAAPDGMSQPPACKIGGRELTSQKFALMAKCARSCCLNLAIVFKLLIVFVEIRGVIVLV